MTGTVSNSAIPSEVEPPCSRRRALPSALSRCRDWSRSAKEDGDPDAARDEKDALRRPTMSARSGPSNARIQPVLPATAWMEKARPMRCSATEAERMA